MTLKKYFFINIALALAYFILGKLGLSLSLPPGYVTAIWPAAGVALGGCLLFKARYVWVGIFIGSTLINTTVGGAFQLGMLPFIIALGSTIQAVMTKFYLVKYDPEIKLDNSAAVLRCVVVVMIGCLTAPIIGNSALLLFGVISTQQLLSSFITWWFGDLLGVVIFAPLMLLTFDKRTVWSSRRFHTGTTMVFAFLFCFFIYLYVSNKTNNELKNSFLFEASVLTSHIENIKDGELIKLSSLVGFFQASEHVSLDEFSRFSNTIMNDDIMGLRALSWAPLIHQDKLSAFVQTISEQQRQPFKVWRPEEQSSNPNGWLVPVTYIEPLAGNTRALGLDLNSEENRATSIERARLSGQISVSKKIKLAQDPLSIGGILIMAPVSTAKGDIVSFCTAVIDLSAVKKYLAQMTTLSWELQDLSEAGEQLVANSKTRFPSFEGDYFQNRSGVFFQTNLLVADRTWRFIIHQSYADLNPDQAYTLIIIMLLAFSICGVIGGLSLISGGERHRINEMIIQKTAALTSEVERRRTYQADLQANEQRYHSLFDESPVGHALNRFSDGGFIDVNQSFTDITGYDISELNHLTFWQLTPERYKAQEEKQLKLLNSTGRYGPYDKHYRHKKGHLVAVRLNGTLIDAPNGEKLILLVVEDISEQERAENRLKLLAKVFHHSVEAILITDHDNRIVDANESCLQTTGYRLDEIFGKNPKMLAAGRTPIEVYKAMWFAINTRGYWQGELWDKRKDGTIYPKWLTISVVKNERGDITNYIGSFTDISERKKAEQQIYNLAHHDPLTQLPNRFNLQLRLDQVFSSAKRESTKIAVMFIDMDRFKNINDTLGHHMGDKLLIEVANRLRHILRDSDIVARIGGDEFVVVLHEISDSTAPKVAEKILHGLGEPYIFEQHSLHSSPSIGISLYPEDGDTVEVLMKNADMAMYQAKSLGRNNYQFFTQAMNKEVAERLQLEVGLRQALVKNEFILHYQPQIEVTSGKVVAVEALIRWQVNTQELMPPVKFIPIAEETGLIVEIGHWVLREALAQLSVWRKTGLPELRMAVNISSKQFHEAALVDTVAELLSQHGLENNALELEITEGVAMESLELNVLLFARLRENGCELSIDDFATGYSSLSYLKWYPLDRLKLDRSFVKDLEFDPNDAAICAATINLSHSLGLTVVAEGVENAEQLKFLSNLGCDIVQGFYYSKPLPSVECLDFIKKHNAL